MTSEHETQAAIGKLYLQQLKRQEKADLEDSNLSQRSQLCHAVFNLERARRRKYCDELLEQRHYELYQEFEQNMIDLLASHEEAIKRIEESVQEKVHKLSQDVDEERAKLLAARVAKDKKYKREMELLMSANTSLQAYRKIESLDMMASYLRTQSMKTEDLSGAADREHMDSPHTRAIENEMHSNIESGQELSGPKESLDTAGRTKVHQLNNSDDLRSLEKQPESSKPVQGIPTTRAQSTYLLPTSSVERSTKSSAKRSRELKQARLSSAAYNKEAERIRKLFNPTISDCGKFYTSPSILRGVPVDKLTDSSPYLSKTWITFEGALSENQESIKKKEAKLDALMSKFNKVETHTEQSENQATAKLIKEISAAQASLRDAKSTSSSMTHHRAFFQHTAPFHPNQLVAKSYITSRGLININYLQPIHSIYSKLKEAEKHGLLGGLSALMFFRREIWVSQQTGQWTGSLFLILHDLRYHKAFHDIWQQLDDIKTIAARTGMKPSVTAAAVTAYNEMTLKNYWAELSTSKPVVTDSQQVRKAALKRSASVAGFENPKVCFKGFRSRSVEPLGNSDLE